MAILFAIYHAIDRAALLRLFQDLSLPGILVLVGISFLLILVSAIKWRLFLTHLGVIVPLFRLFKLYLVGYFVNLLLPSFLGGDAMRSFELGKSAGQHRVAAATIMERYTGFTAMLILGCIVMNFSDLVTWQMESALAALLLMVIGLTVLTLNKRASAYICSFPIINRIEPHIEKLRDGFLTVLNSKKVLIESYLLSFLYHSLTVLNTYACALAVGWSDPSIKSLFVVLPLILTVGALPISPHGLGIQEGAFYFFLTHLGATAEQAIGIALILRAKGYVLALLGGIFWYFRRRDDQIPAVVIIPDEA